MPERVCQFECGDSQLIGVLSLPQGAPRATGVVIVVGGDQVRTGSHRQFTLLARHLSACGYAVLRFDWRGMGDSEGAVQPFDARGDELTAAIGSLFDALPGMRQVVLWGLCDGASAALLQVAHDRRVAGLALLNPWVGDARLQAKATLRLYYRKRILEPAFWAKLGSGQFQIGRALRGLGAQLAQAWRAAPRPAEVPAQGRQAQGAPIERMLAAWQGFTGPVLVLLSGADLTAQGFKELARASKAWRTQLQRATVTCHELPEADHTCSRPDWHHALEDLSAAWLKRCFPDWLRH